MFFVSIETKHDILKGESHVGNTQMKLKDGYSIFLYPKVFSSGKNYNCFQIPYAIIIYSAFKKGSRKHIELRAPFCLMHQGLHLLILETLILRSQLFI